MSPANVSVVIPAYNASTFIVEALNSVASQSTLPTEVIVVDDGSRDDTAALVLQWIEQHTSGIAVELIRQENQGSSATRNAGMRRATGEWIALLDADDVWQSDHLHALLNAAVQAPTAIGAYGAGRLFVDHELNPKLYDEFWDNPSKRFGKPIADSHCLRITQAIFPRLIKGNFIKPSSLIFRRSALSVTGMFDTDLRTGEDREFLVRLLLYGDLVYYPNSVTLYRWHEENLSHTKNARRNLENSLRVLDRIVRNPALSPARQADCRAEVIVAIEGYLYVCSTTGWRAYRAGIAVVRKLFGRWRAVCGFNPKHLLRAVFM